MDTQCTDPGSGKTELSFLVEAQKKEVHAVLPVMKLGLPPGGEAGGCWFSVPCTECLHVIPEAPEAFGRGERR